VTPILVAERVPAVLSARPVGRLAISYVDVDGAAGAGLAVDDLVERGRRRIATNRRPQDMAAGQDRLRGWEEALAAHGLVPGPIAYGDFDRGSGARAMEELLAAGEPLDGVFVASDVMALDALAVLRGHALRVPDDIAVVGFDDSVAATLARPPLTTVRPTGRGDGQGADAHAARPDRRPGRTDHRPGVPAEADPARVDLSSAVVIARDFTTVSACSAAGSESATTAPPTPNETRPGVATRVRITTLSSAGPASENQPSAPE
jgi:hypothetical protein